MDIQGLLAFLNGLIASSLMVIHLMLATASGLLTSFATNPQEVPPSVHIASTTPSISLSAATSSPKTPFATSTASTIKKTTAKKPVATEVATKTTPTPTPSTPLVTPEEVNILARASIVNILCISQAAGNVRSISGSGVIVDSRGVILTNAHIGQYFLLRDYPTKNAVDCTIRTGSPASPMYRAALLYLPPAWVSENASQIVAEQGTGTGENDYAFLRITSTTNPAGTLPKSFTNMAMSGLYPETGDSVLVAGYPAGFLDAQTIEKNLYATTAFTQIGQLYTFDTANHIDVVSLGGTVVSQGGSSGGAVVRTYDGKLTGLIATATSGETTATRDLRAITVAYLDRSLYDAGQGGIAEFLLKDLTVLETNFAPTFALEKQKLVDVLSKH
jgi:hypothetical protein